MRVFIFILGVLALALVVYNLTLINYSDPFGEDSITAVITTLCGCCVLLILAILLRARKIESVLKRRQ